ncbi:MAG TPA: hypothetical protein VFE98_08650 [Candidatus Bathyarchaeia archaeon]|nr:hypothetical protein [Candidatus Bathyarchaeia archaeon]
MSKVKFTVGVEPALMNELRRQVDVERSILSSLPNARDLLKPPTFTDVTSLLLKKGLQTRQLELRSLIQNKMIPGLAR